MTSSTRATRPVSYSPNRPSKREILKYQEYCRPNDDKVNIDFTLNICSQQLGANDALELKGKIQEALAESGSVDPAAVSMVHHDIGKNDKEVWGAMYVYTDIRTADVNSAKSLEKAMAMDTTNIAKNVLQAASLIPGVRAAAKGELKVTDLEVWTNHMYVWTVKGPPSYQVGTGKRRHR